MTTSGLLLVRAGDGSGLEEGRPVGASRHPIETRDSFRYVARRRLSLAGLSLKLGRRDESLKLVELALSESSADVGMAGTLLIGLGQKERAIRLYRRFRSTQRGSVRKLRVQLLSAGVSARELDR